jgi:NADPH:quinone reductase-like Zn-dependent oxidoreductase
MSSNQPVSAATAASRDQAAAGVIAAVGPGVTGWQVGRRARIWDTSLASLAPTGTLVSSGAFLGRHVEVDLPRLYLQGQRIVGVRSGNAASIADLWTEVDRGFRPVLDTTFPLADAAGAHRYLEDGQNVGRVSLLIPPVEPAATAGTDQPCR